jgi:uncharacterized protein YecT (DUF1311 family)
MRAGLVLIGCCALAAAACGGSSTGPTDSSSPPAGPSAGSENFTTLPCHSNTTVGMEGCAEHRILRADAVINREVRVLWTRAGSSEARTHLAAAQAAWQDYRTAACTSEADAFTGGSLTPVVVAQCSLRLTRQRAMELRRQVRLLSGG